LPIRPQKRSLHALPAAGFLRAAGRPIPHRQDLSQLRRVRAVWLAVGGFPLLQLPLRLAREAGLAPSDRRV